MTVFLTPEGKPFYGGTYFPPVDRHNLPGFPKILTAVARAYEERPQDVEKATGQILGNLEKMKHRQETTQPLRIEALANAAASLAQHVDHTHGGIGGAPKFPNSMVFALFLRQYHATGNELYRQMATLTLRKMAEGGVYDHLGGGFHRYSVDERWLVPHFEKMLYDNALLARLYLEAYQVTAEPLFRGVVEEILAYVEREMLRPGGGFYSTQDADSEGQEGKFFVWSRDEVMSLLGEEGGEVFCRYYDVTDVGNFEHQNILHPTLTVAQLAKLFRRDEESVGRLLNEARRTLFTVRERRVKPGRDDKILTSWNGLMLSAFIEAYKVLGNSRYLAVARQTTDFLLTCLYQDGRLLRSYKDGQAKFNAYLDDYAFLAAALIDLYEATFEEVYLRRAIEFIETVLARFWDDKEGGFFFTSDDHEVLITRSKPVFDGSIPSGNSAALLNLLRLSYLTENQNYLAKAEQVLRLYYEAMEQNPFGFSNMLCALDFYLNRPKEIVLLGEKNAIETREMVSRIHTLFMPNKTLRCLDPHDQSGTAMPSVLNGRTQIERKLTAYVCQNFTCSLPVTDWGALKELLV